MRYLGGKKRQAKEIVRAVERLTPDFKTYVEPFCGALWSAVAMMQRFPDRKYILNDINPHLICFWEEARRGWNPPAKVSEATYAKYNRERPLDDPMTGYVGFALSFGGKFFGGFARDRAGQRDFEAEASRSTLRKIDTIRTANVLFKCGPYHELVIPNKAAVYLDPPYEGRTRQSHFGKGFDKEHYLKWASALSKRCVTIATEFIPPSRWRVLYNYGDTVVRHLNGLAPDGTVELLMQVRP